MANSLMQNETLQHKVLKMIPLRIIWTAGVPSVDWNPENESIALVDTGAGDVNLTFAVASLVPLKLLGMGIEVADANTLGLVGNMDGAATTSVMNLVFNAASDGATETDPVAVDLLIGKYVVA